MTSNTDTLDSSAPREEATERREPDSDDASDRGDATDRTGDDASDRGDASNRTGDREPGPLSSVPYAEFDVDTDDAVAAECPYCDRPFSTEAARDLHVGEDHADDCTDEQRAAYEAASDAETDDLFYFHLRIVAALGVLYGVVVLVYMLALGSGVI